ncbi:hypothetical protein M2160_004465 [Streptomyces sp. SAI-117]|nr:hypothetical protein [Streptomyces sp. SAI-117]
MTGTTEFADIPTTALADLLGRDRVIGMPYGRPHG